MEEIGRDSRVFPYNGGLCPHYSPTPFLQVPSLYKQYASPFVFFAVVEHNSTLVELIRPLDKIYCLVSVHGRSPYIPLLYGTRDLCLHYLYSLQHLGFCFFLVNCLKKTFTGHAGGEGSRVFFNPYQDNHQEQQLRRRGGIQSFLCP